MESQGLENNLGRLKSWLVSRSTELRYLVTSKAADMDDQYRFSAAYDWFSLRKMHEACASIM